MRLVFKLAWSICKGSTLMLNLCRSSKIHIRNNNSSRSKADYLYSPNVCWRTQNSDIDLRVRCEECSLTRRTAIIADESVIVKNDCCQGVQKSTHLRRNWTALHGVQGWILKNDVNAIGPSQSCGTNGSRFFFGSSPSFPGPKKTSSPPGLSAHTRLFSIAKPIMPPKCAGTNFIIWFLKL